MGPAVALGLSCRSSTSSLHLAGPRLIGTGRNSKLPTLRYTRIRDPGAAVGPSVRCDIKVAFPELDSPRR